LDTDAQDLMPNKTMALELELAHALWVWEAASLELGDLAILAGDASHDRLIAMVAALRSGRRVLAIARDGAAGNTGLAIETLDPSDQPATFQRLNAAVAAAPGAAAVIRDGSAAQLELILEVMPVWGRVVLATRAGEPATIDFYNNVHRKGCRIVTVPAAPAQMDEVPWRHQAGQHLTRAARVLRSRPALVDREK
jgi:hypothetical protein